MSGLGYLRTDLLGGSMWPWTEKAHRRMQRKSTAAMCLILAVILLACSRNGPPNSLCESSGYRVRDGKVYYLNALPGKAVEITDADPATFEAFDPTYGRGTANTSSNASTSSATTRALRAARRRALLRQSRRLLERRIGALRRPRALHESSPTSTTTCTPRTAAPFTSTAIRWPTPTRRHCKSCKALTHATTAMFSISISRLPMRTFRHSVRSRAPTPLIPHASTGWAKKSTGRTPAPSVCSCEFRMRGG